MNKLFFNSETKLLNDCGVTIQKNKSLFPTNLI
jgi:hypothetical protein